MLLPSVSDGSTFDGQYFVTSDLVLRSYFTLNFCSQIYYFFYL